jgi:hypothetical protein
MGNEYQRPLDRLLELLPQRRSRSVHRLTHINADVQTELNEDPNVYGVNDSLQSGLPPALKSYENAVLKLLNLLAATSTGSSPLDADAMRSATAKARAAPGPLVDI